MPRLLCWNPEVRHLARGGRVVYEGDEVRRTRSHLDLLAERRVAAACCISYLWETIQSARARGGYAKKAWIGGTAAWHICGHHCGYLMKKDDRTYGVFGIYYRDLNSDHLA